MNRKRGRRKFIDGVLLLDKPAGISSNRALQQARGVYQARKAGHTGSLDPIATGLLPVCFGEATKLSQFFLGTDKRYWTRLKLGERRDTGDIEGHVVQRRDVDVNEDRLQAARAAFTGNLMQTPPMYSAIKRQGQPLYKLARQGIKVERMARPVTVYDLKLNRLTADQIDLDIHCSSGFYVRSLAEDIGEYLGCGAYVEQLRRTAVGHFSVQTAHTLEDLRGMENEKTRLDCLIAEDQALPHIPEVQLSADATYYLCRGQAVRAARLPETGWVRLYGEGAGFLGLGQVLEDGRVTPKRLFHRR